MTSINLDCEICVTTPSGEVLCASRMLRSYKVLLGKNELVANLAILKMHDFNIILGLASCLPSQHEVFRESGDISAGG